MKVPVAKLGLSCVLAIGFSSFSFAQTNAPAVDGSAGQMTVTYLQSLGNYHSPGVQGFDNRYQGMNGHPYFVDVWLPGKLEVQIGNTQKTQPFTGLKLKYDVYSNQLGAIIPATKDTLLLSTDVVKSFQMELPGYDQMVEFRKYPQAAALDPKLANTFFAILHQGNATLLKGAGKLKIDANYKGAYSANQPFDQLVDQVHYFVLNNGQMQKVKLNRKSILNALVDQEEKLKDYLKKEKLSLNTEQELIKVIAYYNSL
ncbi:hypothetical protein [Rufibacter roseus]|uniref:Uncharacterized protein n=1 Tax=Rufibacter roseus TaxID=1567108 RepID=A0ABW2DSN2_9BACT|nr:hypothetical protein [Rufibacter roseus]